MRVPGLAGAVVLAACLAGCGSSSQTAATTETVTTPPATTSTTTVATTTQPAPSGTNALTLYFVQKDGLAAARRKVPATRTVGTAALEALFAGPDPRERGFGLSSALPGEVELKKLSITDGVATVELAPAVDGVARSQVVYTLTQFPTVRFVRFAGESTRLGRTDLPGVPAILVESPGFGDTVTSPLRITGTADTFEANFEYEVVVDERIVATSFVTATSGTGTRGTFDKTITFPVARSALGELVVFERSAANGERTKIREIPLSFVP
ncbi:MAG: hypothetical protein QOE36_2196 [Gaiellaceae bacterium]|jgi:hypothetical protein|nr:hypothetical protein [Gaiellaceae bacterium]